MRFLSGETFGQEKRGSHSLIVSLLFLASIFLLLIYLYFSNINLSFQADLFSAIFMFVSSLVILLGIRDFEVNHKFYRPLGFGFIVWTLADWIWFYLAHFTETDPSTSIWVNALYASFNLFLLVAVSRYFLANLHLWPKLQFYTDLVATLIVFLVIAVNQLGGVIADLGITTSQLTIIYPTLISDIAILYILIVLLSSINLINLLPSQVIFGFSVISYVLIDLYYVLIFALKRYQPNESADELFYVVSGLLVFAIVLEYFTNKGRSINLQIARQENFAKSNLLWWMAPLIAVAALTRILIPEVVFRLIAIGIMYFLVRKIIQISNRNEQYFLNEQKISRNLETTIQDRTLELVEANLELEKQTNTDPLTGVYSRRYFMGELEKRILERKEPFSILHIDILNFHLINDLHGNTIGDEVLIELGKRASEFDYDDHFIARLGGDEFGLILSSTDEQKISQLSEQIIHDIERPLEINSYVFNVLGNIGIVRYPIDASDINTLLKYASLALNHAKQTAWGKKYAFYQPALMEQVEQTLRIDYLLRTTLLPNDTFMQHYQPQFDIATGSLVGMEALIRWKHPKMGFISPGRFIPLAEKNGTIRQITRWTMETAAKQITKWNTSWRLNLQMSVNISPQLFNLSTFFPFLEELIEKHNIKPHWLAAEITEYSNIDAAPFLSIWAKMKDLGINLSIDDFGTGYSSLSYLVKYNASELKIAKELVDNIQTGTKDVMVVKTITTVAKQLGLITIAEGVEHKAQMDILHELGVDRIQGYYTGRPVPANEFEEKFLKPFIRAKYN